MTKQARVGTEWAPTAQQMAFLREATECGMNRSIPAIAKAAGVPRRTAYNWFERDEGFNKAWGELWKKILERHFPSAVAATAKAAQRGEVTASRLMADLLGLLKSKVELGADESLAKLIANAPRAEDSKP